MLTALQLSQLILRFIDDANRGRDLYEKINERHVYNLVYHLYFLCFNVTRDIIAINTFNPTDEYWIRIRHN